MASFTDVTPQFKEYVPQMPVEAMVQVGMQKQKLYKENVQKIQSQIDNVAGLDVMKDPHKKYLQSKLNELGSNLTTFAAGDFSNFQLTNAVSGMTGQIIKDPIIQNAVSSTAKARKTLSDIEAAKKSGTYDPAHEAVALDGIGKWMNDKDINSSYTGEYTPYFDVDKYVRETFNAIKPDGLTYEQVYQTDGNGKIMTDAKGHPIVSPAMKKITEKGIFPPTVQATLDHIFSDPRVAQEMNIRGQYNYRGLSGQALAQKVVDQGNDILKGMNQRMDELNLQKNTGKDVQKDIDDLQHKITTVVDGYSKFAKNAFDNPDVVRGALYEDNQRHWYTTMFGRIERTEETVENPVWKANFELQKEANLQSYRAQQLRYEGMRVGIESRKADIEAARLAFDISKGGKKTGDGSAGPGVGPGGQTPTTTTEPTSEDYYIQRAQSEIENAGKSYLQNSNSLIWNAVMAGDPKNETALNNYIQQHPNVSKEDAINAILEDHAKQSGQSIEQYRTNWIGKALTQINGMPPKELEKNQLLKDIRDAYIKSKRNYDGLQPIKDNLQKIDNLQLTEDAKNIMSNLKPIPGNLNGQPYVLTPQNQIDLAIVARGNSSDLPFMNEITSRSAAKAATDAADRLRRDGKDWMIRPYLRTLTRAGKDILYQPVTGLARTIVGGIDYLGSLVTGEKSAEAGIDWGPVNKVYDVIKNETYQKAKDAKAEYLKSHYSVSPNYTVSLMSGDKSTDRGTLSSAQAIANSYRDVGNVSSGYKDFIANINPNKEQNLVANITTGADGNPAVELALYDGGAEKGKLTLKYDQAASLGVSPADLLQTESTSVLKDYMTHRNGKTCVGNPGSMETYTTNADYWFSKNDFTKVVNNAFDVKANIVYSNGLYYPYIYASNGQKQGVQCMSGLPNLDQAVMSLQNVNDAVVNAIIVSAK